MSLSKKGVKDMITLENRTVHQGREFFEVFENGTKIGIAGHDLGRGWANWSFLPVCGQYMTFKSKKALVDCLTTK